MAKQVSVAIKGTQIFGSGRQDEAIGSPSFMSSTMGKGGTFGRTPTGSQNLRNNGDDGSQERKVLRGSVIARADRGLQTGNRFPLSPVG